MLNGNRSISLIDSFSELFSKALADRFRTPETYGQTQPKRFHKKTDVPKTTSGTSRELQRFCMANTFQVSS